MAGKIITIAQQKGGSGKTTLAATLGVAFADAGQQVALLDTDPQGSLGRWFMARRDALEDPGLDFGTASAWGVGYEVDRLGREKDIVIIDTPPKLDSDLRHALRPADLALVPVAMSHVDLWAVEGVLEMAERTDTPAVVVLTRNKAGTRLGGDIAATIEKMGVPCLDAALANRVAYAEALGQGLSAQELRRTGPAMQEISALRAEIQRLI